MMIAALPLGQPYVHPVKQSALLNPYLLSNNDSKMQNTTNLIAKKTTLAKIPDSEKSARVV